MPKKPVLCLFGPTGVGKTELLFRHFSPWSEVVVVDSIQVYRGFDIGSAKPSLEERTRLVHHLVDIRDPQQPFDAGDFVAEAKIAIDSIVSRGKIPVLSGGTAFYFVQFLNGLPETPVSDAVFRERSEIDWSAWGEREFRRRLSEVDPASEARILPHDAYRLKRAWEVWLQTGRPLSSFAAGRRTSEYQTYVAALERPREELVDRISRRVDRMIDAGLVDEVKALVDSGYTKSTPAMKGIGYAEFLPWLIEGDGSFEEVVDRIKVRSRQYAKRQMTFFRSLTDVCWFHPDDEIGLRAWIENCRNRIDAR